MFPSFKNKQWNPLNICYIEKKCDQEHFMYIEVMLGISLFSYLSLKLAKMLCLSYYCLCLLFNKLEKRAEQVLPGSKGVWEDREGVEDRGEMAQTLYGHMNK
jgi:hypothetical protein